VNIAMDDDDDALPLITPSDGFVLALRDPEE
jgi:hypothetical protein